jgi:hypothetical integral membrane protein (TIGR02206 family)
MNLGQYFAKDWNGPAFAMFGPAHLTALALIVLLNIGLVRNFKGAGEAARTKLRWTMAIILWANELGWHIWNYATGQWTIQTMLPLHLCSVLVWVGALALVTMNYSVYEFMYFMGIAGALQALLTPDIGIYGFPHYRFWQTYVSHGLIVTAAIYMTLVERFRPTWKSLGRVVVWMNIYMGIVFVVNMLIGSNYLFIAHKPPTASLLDLLPPWPYYIAYIEVIGLVMCLLLYVPFIIKDWRAKQSVQSRV